MSTGSSQPEKSREAVPAAYVWEERPAGTLLSSLKQMVRLPDMAVIIPLVILSAIVGILNPAFFEPENVINVLRATSFTMIVGIGMTVVLIAGGLDLSVGSQLALGSYVTALALTKGLPVPVAILIGILAGAVVGSTNGFVIVNCKIPAFIATLGMLYIARGVVLISSKGVPIYPLPISFNALGQDGFLSIPYIVVIAALLSILASFTLKKTIYGRAVYAVGGNEEAARLSGIDTARIKFTVYVLVGALATFTGLLQAARLGSAQPNIGSGFELQVIAAVIIGGTSLFGGAGTILGTFLGALFMTVLSNAMSLLRVSAYWQQLVVGTIIILAVGLDRYRRTRKQ